MACACTMVRRMRTAATQDDYTDSNFASLKTLVLPLTAHTYQARLVSARNACRDFRDRSAHFPNPPSPHRDNWSSAFDAGYVSSDGWRSRVMFCVRTTVDAWLVVAMDVCLHAGWA